MEVKEDGGSFPTNYVTIHDLKQRWLQQQQQQQQQQEQIPKKSNHESNPKPTTPPRNHHRHRSRKSPPPPHVHNNVQPVHDDDEKTLATKPMSDQNPSQPVEKHQTRIQKPKHKTTPLPPPSPQNDDDAPPRHRSRNRKSKHKLSASPEKQQHQPQLHSRNQNPKHSTKTEPNPAPVEQWSRNNKVVIHPKTPPFDAVREINVCNVSHTKEGYGRFHGGSTNRYPKPPSWGKKPQISQVWVKKGESAPN